MCLRGVTKSFGSGKRRVHALRDVWLEVRAATITGLLGPNGAGKSTLMLTASGLVRPDAGRCEIVRPTRFASAGTCRAGLPPGRRGLRSRFHRRRGSPSPCQTGRLPGRGRVQDCLERFGLSLPLDRRIARCSHGTARRLALACAVIGEPRLLVLDEPTSGLDVASRELLLGELVRFRERGGTILVSSHVLSDLEQICDGLAIIENGRLTYEGDLRPGRALSEIYRRRTGK